MTYDKKFFEDRGVKVTDSPFADGSIPPASVIQTFLSLCDERFPGGIAAAAAPGGNMEPDGSGPAIVCTATFWEHSNLLKHFPGIFLI
jgi:hypothetical protein